MNFHDLKSKATKRWCDNTAQEIAFWDEWLKTGGLQWHDEFENRMNPVSDLQSLFHPYIHKGATNYILDVGAGPMTTINKEYGEEKICICPTDPLAHYYRALLKKYSLEPPVYTEFCYGEKLTKKFGESSFDIVYSRNALDHSYNPMQCLQEMVRCTKSGGYIIFEIIENEGKNEHWTGLHQWNLFLTNNEEGSPALYIQNKQGESINSIAPLQSYTELMLLQKEHEWIQVILKKR